MFEKILSLMEFDSSKSSKMTFYLGRLKQEKSIRRIGLIFITLAFLMQFFVVINPPKSTSASSSNDLVTGGFNSAAEAANDCIADIQDYQKILNYYGISCQTVANAKTITINSRDWNGSLWSMGRNDVGNLPGETPTAPINGVTYFVRYLWGWDSPGTSSNYQALNVTSPGGQTFLLLYNCGNIVSVGFPAQVSQPPSITGYKTTEPGSPIANSNVKPGTSITFRVSLSNSGGPATNVKIKDPVPNNLDFVSISQGLANGYVYDLPNNQTIWSFDKINAGANNQYVNITYKVSSKAPDKSKICNQANITGDNVSGFSTNSVCFAVDNAAPKPVPTPPTCPYDKSINLNDPRCIPCPGDNSIVYSNPKCKPCEKNINSSNTTSCVIYSKGASNITQNINDANGTLAQPGDVINYTLTAKNTGSSDVKNFVFQDNLSYILIYADLIKTNGGVLDNKTKSIVFPSTSLPKGATKTVSFEVKIMSPIPQTPASTSDPFYYNSTMLNTYGNTVKINLPKSAQKQIEIASSQLPNTGPGMGIFIAFIAFTLAGYFYYRTRLIAIEADIAIKDNASRSIQK